MLTKKITNYKGIILQYLKNEEPYYIYAPFILNDISSNEYYNWVKEQTELKETSTSKIKNIIAGCLSN